MRNHDPRSNWQSGSANESGSERGRQQGGGGARVGGGLLVYLLRRIGFISKVKPGHAPYGGG